jgi:hypothetical protein
MGARGHSHRYEYPWVPMNTHPMVLMGAYGNRGCFWTRRWPVDLGVVRKLIRFGRTFLQCYHELSAVSVNERTWLWKLRPKFHYSDHTFRRLLVSRLNPRRLSCFIEEDLMGVLKRIGKSCHGLSASRQMLLRCFIKWVGGVRGPGLPHPQYPHRRHCHSLSRARVSKSGRLAASVGPVVSGGPAGQCLGALRMAERPVSWILYGVCLAAFGPLGASWRLGLAPIGPYLVLCKIFAQTIYTILEL